MEENLKRVYEDYQKELKKKYRNFFALFALFSLLKGLLMGIAILLFTEIILLFLRIEFTNFLRFIYGTFLTILSFILQLKDAREKIGSLAGSGEELRNAIEISNSRNPWESLELKILFLKRVLNLLIPAKDFIKKNIPPYPIYLSFILACGAYFSLSFIKIEKKSSYSPDIFKEAILRITPPSYTKLEPYEVKSSNGRFKVLKGSRVEIDAKLVNTKGVPSFKICGEKIPFKKEGDKFRIEFTMERECEFEVQIENRFSIRHFSPFYFELETDEYPEVELISPRDDIVMKKGERDIEVYFSASDDYGITSIQLVYLFSGRELRNNYEKISGDSKREEGKFLIEASKFPGDMEVYFYIEVMDNDAVSGPKISRSEKRKIHIIGEFSAHEQKIKEIRDLYEKSVRLLAGTIGYFKGKIHGKKLIEEINRLKRDAEMIKKDLGTAEISNSLKSFLFSLPERLENLKKMTSSEMRKEAVSEAEEIVYKFTEELRLQTISDAYATAERIKKLLEMAKDSLREGKKELAEILTKKAEEEMERLKGLISQLPSEILTEFINPDALRSVESMEGKEKSLDQYIQSLEELIKNLESAGRSIAMGGNPELFKKLQEAREKISSLIEKETQLKNETEGAVSRCMGGSPEENFESLIKRTEKLLKNPKIRQIIKNKLKGEPDALKELLKNSKLAFEAGKRRESAGYLQDFEWASEIAGAYEREFFELARKARELRERILKENRVYEEIPVDEAQRMGEKQAGIRKETEDLSSKVGDVVPSLKEAERHMQDAEGMLRGRLMENAIDSEEKAINALKGAENEVSQRISEIEEGWKGMARFLREGEEMGRELSTERVEIPEKEETFLKELRKDVIEMLKRGLPKRHEEENRRYYEEIIK